MAREQWSRTIEELIISNELGDTCAAGMNRVLKVLQPVKDAFPQLSWADLIVFASHVAIEDSAAAAAAPAPQPFCPGRTDATADNTVTSLQVNPLAATPPLPPSPQLHDAR